MKIKRHTISVIRHFLLSSREIDSPRKARYQSIPESTDCERIVVESASIPVQSDSNPDYTGEGIRNGNQNYSSFSIPCEDVRDDALRYPKARQLAYLYGSFSFARVLKRTKKNLCRTYPLHAETRIFRHVIELRQNTQHFFWSDGAAIWVLSPRTAPTFGTASHTAGNELHPTTIDQHPHSSVISGLFFENTLDFRVGSSDHGAGLPQSKSKLTEKPLTLANAQCNPKIFPDKCRQ
jgi:hypothetical protein